MTTIAVDAMGGDRAPQVVVEGAVMATKFSGASISLVGDEDLIHREISRLGVGTLPIQVVHAPETIAMTESAGLALRKRRESSIWIGLDLVRSGQAEAFVSAGNSGAVMALAMHTLGNLPGVDRPAIASILPTGNGSVVLIDCGANIECTPWNLAQFAVMGDIYARLVLGHERPRLGILSNGEEEEKGTALTRATSQILRGFDHMNYIGYVEGRNILSGNVDVIVADGFTGNVALKAIEGFGLMMEGILRDAFQLSLRSKLGYLLAKPSLQGILLRMDYAEYGGAPLLGVKGIAIVAHGGSNAKAVMNAIRVALESVNRNVNREIIQEVEKLGSFRDKGESGKRRRYSWSHLLRRFASRKQEPGDGEG